MAKTSTGIDIGMRTSKVIRGRYKGNTFHVTNFAVALNEGSQVEDGWAALADLDFKPKGARVGLTGRDVNIRYTRVPQVPDWQLRNLMRFEVAEIGDQSGSEVASDFNLLPQLPEVEGEDVVLLAMAREQLLEAHRRGLEDMGGSVECFSPGAVALYNAWLRYGAVEEETVLLANIGHDNIDVVISRGPDLLFARNLTGGSRLFDEAIMQRFGCGAERAEKVKIEMATLRTNAQHETPNHERASRAILGAAGQLLSLVQSAILFCKSQVKVTSLKVDRVLLCGGGAALDGLTDYLSAGMGVPVELFDAFRVVDTSALDAESAEQLDEYRLEGVVALGLATMSSDPEAYSLEILPAALAKRRAFFGGTLWLVAAAVLAVGYLGFSAVMKSRRLGEVAGQNRTLASSVRTADRVNNETQGLILENERLGELVGELQAVAGTGEQLARIVTFLDRWLPDDFWLTHLSSHWSHDDELGVGAADPRPILLLKGRAREGAASPTAMHQRMVDALYEAMPSVRLNHSFDRDVFSVDLTLFSPEPGGQGDGGEAAGSDETGQAADRRRSRGPAGGE